MSNAALSARSVVLTGGAGVIGTATAAALLDAGAMVAIASRDQERLDSAADRLGAAESPVLTVRADITDEDGVAEIVDRTMAAYGRIDVVINLAGTVAPIGVDTWEIEPREWRAALDVNLTGAFLISSAVIPVMLEQQEGRLLFLSSTAADLPFAGAAPYAAAKAAVNQFVRTLAAELDGTGVTALAFNPGPTDGPVLRQVRSALFPEHRAWLSPLARRDPSEAAQLIVDLCCAPGDAHNGQFVSWLDPTEPYIPRGRGRWAVDAGPRLS